MLETIREYATARLAASGEETAIRRRHADHVVALAERLEPDVYSSHSAAALDRLDVEHDNARAAFDWSRDTGRRDVCLRLAEALSWYWFVRGHWAEGVARLDTVLSAPLPAGAPTARARLGRALLNVLLGHADEADEDAREALRVAEAGGDTALRAHALERLALVAQERGDTALAGSLHEQVADLSRETGDRVLLCIALDNLADVAIYEDRFEDAAQLAAEAVDAARQTGNLERVASALINLATALLALGRAADAAEQFAEALRCAHEIGAVMSTAYALEGLGCAAAELGVPEAAARLLAAAEMSRRRLSASWQPFEADRHERAIARLRDGLGNEGLARGWGEGRVMTVDAAVRLGAREITNRRLISSGGRQP
jgi:tetratricopeptide (TPR) repeat protein